MSNEFSKPFLDAKPWDVLFGRGAYAPDRSVPGEPSGAFTSQAEKEAFIRESAAKAGINPDVAMAVARSEGFNNFRSTIPGEESFGAFQLHLTPGGRGRAVGDQFKELTGLDPSDPKNERETIMFAMEWAKRHGWHDFHGAANGAHLSNWQGIGGSKFANLSGGGSTSTQTFNFTGPISVNGVANVDDFRNKLRDVGLKRQAEANQSSVGAQ
jgi:hypothetical protein